MARLSCRLSYLAAAVLIGTVPAHCALAESSANAQLARDAQNGPRALLDGLDLLLASNPQLAATPSSAVKLARAAATPVSDFVGANLPIYQEISDKIIAAAPPEQRVAVRRAISIELGSRLIISTTRPRPRDRLMRRNLRPVGHSVLRYV